MTRRLLIALMLTVLPLAGFAQTTEDEAGAGKVTAQPAVRFVPLDVRLDTDAAPLAAFQIEIQATTGNVKIVGIEGGEPAAYREPPYYDPAAMRGERVIIADFSTAPADQLPSGRIRIATIHLQVTGDEEPAFEATIQATADDTGAAIDAQITLELRQ